VIGTLEVSSTPHLEIRMKFRNAGIVILASAALLGGCAYPEPYAVYEGRPVVAQRTDYGVVERIEMYREGTSAPIGLGAILGGVAGGILGHQIGSGSGNTAATIAGALGGAAVGHQVERANARDRYRIIVRLDSGGTVVLDQVGEGELRVGDRVRISNRRVYRS
jgi:outer membrane lipoprotein SlyB